MGPVPPRDDLHPTGDGEQRPASAETGAAVDRHSQERTDPDLCARLIADEASLVLEVCDGFFPVATLDEHVRLHLTAPGPQHRDADLIFFLGRDASGRALLAVVIPGSPPPDEDPVRWAGLREAGHLLDARDVELAMTAVALSRWHETHTHCPRCGSPTWPASAGWTRACPQDASEHYPRTDPAVIMAVTDGDGRLLLGRNPSWPQGRFSVLAGFVEPGERLEHAVAREVREEVGIVVTDVRYAGSQPWPFPASLMLGFTARATSVELVLDPAEIDEARWVSRESLAVEVAAGTLGLPGRLSIARRLLETWYGGPLAPPNELPWGRN
jgi:NAD+ diphosphatase